MLKFVPLTLPFLALNLCVFAQKNTLPIFYFGADLSYVNELEDSGVTYKSKGKIVEPYQLFKEKGANLIRLRLWHSPTWTKYSTLIDVKKSIKRAKQNGLQVLLDFHYSDDWADPAHQIIPKAWKDIQDLNILGDSVYKYTFSVLEILQNEDLTPEMVQVGNETNSEVMMQKPTKENGPTDWKRNAFLLLKGLEAVHDFNKKYQQKTISMLHVAQPDEAKAWFENAAKQNLLNFEFIGLSYYPNWSKFNLEQLKETMTFLKNTYKKEVMVIETGYPFNLTNVDKAGNVLGDKAGLDGFSISKEGQLAFMKALTQTIIDAGGNGVIYWEPAWVSSSCKTQWGTGSHWENAAFFDSENGNESLPVFEFMKVNYK